MSAPASVWLRHKGVRFIGLGWAAFTLENLVLSENRTRIIAAYGDKSYHYLYNTLSTLACSTIAYGFLRHGRGQGPRIWKGGGPMFSLCAFALQTLGLVGFSQLMPRMQLPVGLTSGSGEGGGGGGRTAQAPQQQQQQQQQGTSRSPANRTLQARCPLDFTPEDMPEDGIHGVKRVSRHPMMWSLALLGAGTALTTPLATGVVFYSAPAVFAAIGTSHQDSRYRRGVGGTLTKEMEERTSNIPFLALLTGRQSWSGLMKEMKEVNAGYALAVTTVLALRRLRTLR